MLLAIAFVLAVTNFGWQMFTEQDYNRAWERTFFQWLALGLVGLLT